MVTQEVYQDLLISKLLPAILQKWPRRDQLSRKSFIQQDGEKNHISENDRVFKEALMEKGSMGNFALKHYKLAGFGVFGVIQSFNDAVPKHEEELIQAGSAAYENYLQNEINCTWLTLPCCFNQIIKNNGGNNYKIDHISKERLECIGQLPDVMEVVVDAQQLFNTSKSTNDETEDEDTEIG